MHLRALLSGACAALLACAPAFAQTQTNLNVRDAAGTVTATCAWSSGGAVFPCHLEYGMDGAGALHPILTDSGGHPLVSFSGTINVQGGNSVAVKTDGSGATQPISAASLPLPTGASTAANQTVVQAAAGSSSASAVGVQGVSGGLAVPVSGTFWQGTQPVSAAALPLPTGAATAAAQPALNGDGGALAHVTNLPATQAVSAASLPLPSGAATAAKQPAPGAAGAASADVLSVQGVASMTALKTDGSGVTQPVSAASLPLPSGAATAGNQTNVQAVAGSSSASAIGVQGVSGGVAVPVSGAFWQTTQPISGSVTANAGTNLNTSALALDASVNGVLASQASTTSGQKGPLVQGAVTTSAPTYSNAQTDPLSLTTSGALRTDASATTQPVSAAALPLPTGASTAAKQPALGAAGTPSADVLTVQGAASMTALKTDGSGVTQPVSAASLPLPSGAATAANQTNVQASAGSSSSSALGVQGVSGGVPIPDNQTQVNGVTVSTGAGAAGTGSQRTAVAQDTTTIAGSAPGTAGTPSANVVTVQGAPGATPIVTPFSRVALVQITFAPSTSAYGAVASFGGLKTIDLSAFVGANVTTVKLLRISAVTSATTSISGTFTLNFIVFSASPSTTFTDGSVPTWNPVDNTKICYPLVNVNVASGGIGASPELFYVTQTLVAGGAGMQTDASGHLYITALNETAALTYTGTTSFTYLLEFSY